MEMLVSSLANIKSIELVIVREACRCGMRNELVYLADASQRGDFNIFCKCGQEHQIDMKPVFKVGSFDWDRYSNDSTIKTPEDSEISIELKKISNKLDVI
jgi:hypothetical protein